MSYLLLCTIDTYTRNGFTKLALMKSKVKITIIRNPEEKEALKYWKAVAATFENFNPFFDCDFVETWLASIEHIPDLVIFTIEKTVLGAAFLGQKTERRRGVMINTLLLNQSGNKNYDQYWVENNSIFCSPKYTRLFVTHLLEEIKRSADLLHISMATQHFQHALSKQSRQFYSIETTVGYATPLSSQSNSSFQTLLSKNTRYQINRSNRKLTEAFGDIHVVKGEPKNIPYFLERLSQFHIERWGKSAEGSGFQNTYFKAHLNELLTNSRYNLAEIVMVKAGEQAIGFSINFVLNGNVFFYCSGYDSHKAGKHIKLGYSFHYAVMRYYEQQQYKTYDFLGGHYRYKKSLSSQKYNLYKVDIPLKSTKGNIIKLVMKLRNLLSSA
ncbi:hypothetical protein BM527_13130 [Alteromonas sp. Mex14]|nr:hypothetical protein BM527_13130 [Alteromonas sp. Mex14]